MQKNEPTMEKGIHYIENVFEYNDLPPHLLGPAPLVIVEGSYSCHPTLADCYDLKVFVTCSKEEQARRLLTREGERYSGFTARWIPLEEGYFAKFQIEQVADFILDTTC